MARRRWSRSVLVALFASAGTAAAQFGLAYGLEVMAWTAPGSPNAGAATAPGAWSAGLAFTIWVAATSVILGAVAGDRLAGRVTSGRVLRGVWRFAASLAAALGALLTAVPLAAIPARHAEIANSFAPHLLAGIHAVAGVGLGLIVALAAVASRAVAANVAVTTAWLWALAVAAATDGLINGTGDGFGQLAVWEFTRGGPFWGSLYVPGTLLALGAALLVGGLACLPAAGRGERRLGVAISGAIGPMLVAVAYLLADPRAERAPDVQISALYTAPYLVLAGLAGSLLVAAVGTVPAPTRSLPAASQTSVPGAETVHEESAWSTVSATASVPVGSRATPGDAG